MQDQSTVKLEKKKKPQKKAKKSMYLKVFSSNDPILPIA